METLDWDSLSSFVDEPRNQGLITQRQIETENQTYWGIAEGHHLESLHENYILVEYKGTIKTLIAIIGLLQGEH